MTFFGLREILKLSEVRTLKTLKRHLRNASGSVIHYSMPEVVLMTLATQALFLRLRQKQDVNSLKLLRMLLSPRLYQVLVKKNVRKQKKRFVNYNLGLKS